MRKQFRHLSLIAAAAVCISLTACSSGGTNSGNSYGDSGEVIYDPPADAAYPDYSMYEGLWLSDDDNLYPNTYIQITKQGSWQLTNSGETIDEGYIWYEESDGYVSTHVTSERGGAIDGGYLSITGDLINITTCGNFNYVDGRNGEWQGDYGGNRTDTGFVDYSVFEGLWLSSEDNLYPDTYIQFDAKGNWTTTKGGEDTDNGYLQYNEEEGKFFICSNLGGAIDGGYLSMDGDILNITTCGDFNYCDGRGGQWEGGDAGSNWDNEDRTAIESDYSLYEGLWLSEDDSLYPGTYIQFDTKGNWELTKDGETTDEGSLVYNADEGNVYVSSNRGGAIDGGLVRMEVDRFYMSTCGYFKYIDGRNGEWEGGDAGSNWDNEDRTALDNDISMFVGDWVSDEINLYPDTRIKIDANGNWTLTEGGETIDEGNIKYDAYEGGLITYSKRGGAIDGGIVSLDGDQLNISTCGYFNRLDG